MLLHFTLFQAVVQCCYKSDQAEVPVEDPELWDEKLLKFIFLDRLPINFIRIYILLHKPKIFPFFI